MQPLVKNEFGTYPKLDFRVLGMYLKSAKNVFLTLVETLLNLKIHKKWQTLKNEEKALKPT